jgi:hypothetical protein
MWKSSRPELSEMVLLRCGFRRKLKFASADSKWVMGLTGFNLHHLIFLPTGTGPAQTINLGTLGYHWGNWLPNDHQILFLGNEPGYGNRIYLMDFPQAHPRLVTAEGVGVVNYTHFVSPDGQSSLGWDSERNSVAYSVPVWRSQAGAGFKFCRSCFRLAGDGKSVYVYRPAVPVLVYRVELNTGHRQLWKELNPPDPAGINFIRTSHISPDGKAYAYNYDRILSDRYPVDGLK